MPKARHPYQRELDCVQDAIQRIREIMSAVEGDAYDDLNFRLERLYLSYEAFHAGDSASAYKYLCQSMEGRNPILLDGECDVQQREGFD